MAKIQIANLEESCTSQNSGGKEFQQNLECKSTTVMNMKKMSMIQFDEDENLIQIRILEESCTLQNSGGQEFQQNLECKSTTVMNMKKMPVIQFDED
jgi:hypothetical protein